MAKNYKVRHIGMGWPVGTVLPPEFFKEYPEFHLRVGAIQETTEAVTAEFAPRADVNEMPDDELVAENKRLQAALGELPGLNAKLKGEAEAHAAENQRLKAELEKALSDLDAAQELAGLKKVDADKKARDDK